MGLYHKLQQISDTYPSRDAFRYFEDMGNKNPDVTWSYAELMNYLRQAANLFYQCQLGENSTVGLLVPNTPQGQLALFSAEVAGKAMPINPLLSDEHIINLLKAAEATVLVTHSDLKRALTIRKHVPTLEHVFSLENEQLSFLSAIAQCPKDKLLFTPDPTSEKIVALFHTGGTTGTPKLVQHTQANQLAVAHGIHKNTSLSSTDTLINALPLFHVAGSMCFAISALLAGACQILCTPLGARNPNFVTRHWQMVDEQNVTFMGGVPTTLGALIETMPDRKPKSLKAALTGGAVLPVSVQKLYAEKLGLPPQIIYGMTECAGLIAMTDKAPLTYGWTGKAALGMEIRVVESLDDISKPAKPHMIGHVLTKGDTLGPGYTDPTLNKNTFTADGWLITGDLGLKDEQGNLKLTGRAKDLIIRSGHNIDPALIEDAALKHPNVVSAAAIGAPDGYAGELPVLFIETDLDPSTDLDTETLLELIREEVERPAVPKWITVMEKLPITPVGKIYKPALAALAVNHVLSAKVADLGLPAKALYVTEKGGIINIVFQAPEKDHQLIKELMAPFTLDYKIQNPS